MRSLQWIGTACLCVLFLFALSALVEGPEPACVIAEETPPVTRACLLPAEAERPQSIGNAPAPIRRIRALLPSQRPHAPEGASIPLADRNGNPITSGVYIRTVYGAFPPEWLHG